jgi:hypothetical protein
MLSPSASHYNNWFIRLQSGRASSSSQARILARKLGGEMSRRSGMILLLVLSALDLIRNATAIVEEALIGPNREHVYPRLVALLVLASILTALVAATVISILWRWQLPELPPVEIPINVY